MSIQKPGEERDRSVRLKVVGEESACERESIKCEYSDNKPESSVEPEGALAGGKHKRQSVRFAWMPWAHEENVPEARQRAIRRTFDRSHLSRGVRRRSRLLPTRGRAR